MPCWVFNGWAAGPEIWERCDFRRDRLFDYLEQLDGAPERALREVDAVALVGFSMGGSTALRMLLKFPEKVRGLVLVSTTPCMMERRSSEVGGQRLEVRGQRLEEAEWKGMSVRRRAALKLGTQMTFRGNPSPLYAEENLDRGLDYLERTDLRADLLARAAEFARLPVALFQSERDGIVRPSNAAFLSQVFPQASVTLVPGGEHTLPPIVPAEISTAVRLVTLK